MSSVAVMPGIEGPSAAGSKPGLHGSHYAQPCKAPCRNQSQPGLLYVLGFVTRRVAMMRPHPAGALSSPQQFAVKYAYVQPSRSCTCQIFK